MKWWENNVFIGVMALTLICLSYICLIPSTADKVVNTAIGAIAGFVTGFTVNTPKKKEENSDVKDQ